MRMSVPIAEFSLKLVIVVAFNLMKRNSATMQTGVRL